MEKWLLYAIGIYALAFASSYILIFQRLWRLPIQYPKFAIRPKEEVPAYLIELFEQPIQALEALGFQFYECVQFETMIGFDGFKSWEAILYHRELKSYASVTVRRPIEPVNLFDIDFYTFFKDRSLLLTMNGKAHALMGELPNTIVQDPFTADLNVQWQTHQDKLQQLVTQKQPCGLSPESFVRALQSHFTTYVDSLLKAKQIIPIKGTELFQFDWRMALRLAYRIRQGNRRTIAMGKQLRDRARHNPTWLNDIPVELEIDSYHYMQSIEKGHGQRKFGLWFLLVSLGLFIASFTPLFDFPALVILIGVLFLHELGHYLAMRFFRYQDTTMFFLPFFGAAVTGRKDDASLTEKVWVLLAGPLPGMILGIVLALVTYGKEIPPYAHQGIWMLIGLNLLNLLPIFPLDGGKVANLLLFSRYPYTDFLFKVFAVAMLALLGLTSPVALAIAIVVAFTIPAGFRSAKVDSRLRKEQPPLTAEDGDRLLKAIFNTLKQLGYGTLPFIQRYALTKDLVQRHRESHAGWLTRVSLTVLYCLSLLGGTVGSLQAISPRWYDTLTLTFGDRKAFYQRELERADKELQTNPQDVEAHLSRGRMRLMMQDYEGAIADADAVLLLQPNSAEAYSLRSAARRSTGNVKDSEADSAKANVIIQKNVITQANQSLKDNPKNVDAYLKRGRAYYVLKKYKLALKDFDKALRLNPKEAWAYLDRADTRYALRYYKGAIADANKAMRLNSEPYALYSAYSIRSNARKQLGDKKGAMVDKQKAEVYEKKAEAEEP